MTEYKLKELGHALLDEYVELLPWEQPNKKEYVYNLLKERLRGRECHFGQMRSKAELMLATGMLKKMVYAYKIKHAKPFNTTT